MINFLKLFSTLNRKKIRYLVAGGVAVNLYGIERATGDIDLVVHLEQSNLEKLVEVMKELGFKPKVPVKLEDFVRDEKREEWIREKEMKVFSVYDPRNPYFLLDIFVEEPFDFNKVYKERKKIKAGNLTIPVVPIKRLIEMKESVGRPQDIADVYYLKKIEREWENES
ncbi:MAG: nucleotidyl transferase AbiEii/AbiGii toxin family protein [Nitrospirae bacterium]|nr:nucleotidyl transferase AbiEii/AbiGii toxin family protein [Nitrospirota bacterium]